MSKKLDPNTPSGRIGFDARGNAVWQWRTATGEFKADVDTQTVRAIQDATGATFDKVSTPAPSASQGANHNPYSTADAPRVTQKSARRTLDDMRRLSEEIKRTRALQKP